MKREIHRIEPWSAVRIGFFLGLLSGFIFGLINGWAIKNLADLYGGIFSTQGSEISQLMSGNTILFFAVVSALMFSLGWSFLGAIFAVFYNLVAKLFGGLEVTIADHSAASGRQEASRKENEHEDE